MATRMLKVPAMYRRVTETAAAITARGMVRRASRISSPIAEPLSRPPNANAMVDQKITSLSDVAGTKERALRDVADPYRSHETTPSTMTAAATIQLATPPMLFNHLPRARLRTFRQTAIARPAIETVRK